MAKTLSDLQKRLQEIHRIATGQTGHISNHGKLLTIERLSDLAKSIDWDVDGK